VPQIEVSFDIDANGIVHVSAKDMGTGREQSIRITGTTNLLKEEIDRMVRDAQSHVEEDRRRREEVELKNQAEQLVYQTEKQLRDLGEKVPGDLRGTLEASMNDLRSAIASNDPERIRVAADQLRQETYRLSEMLYQSAGAGATSGETQPPGAEDVIDAEYKAQ
jgi:molecular chaperone DnaK